MPRLLPAELSPAELAVYQAVATGRRTSGRQLFRVVGTDLALEGPFPALLAHPALGMVISDVGEAIRYAGTLPAPVRELLILLVARDRGSDYEWYAHAAVARSLGVTEDALAQLLDGGLPRELSAAEEAAAELYGGIRAGQVDDRCYERAVAHFGVAGVVEAVTLVHYYDLLASFIAVFELPMPRDG